jgi:hypothetical protein
MTAPFCQGNGEDHCCYLNGGPCHFLEENTVPGRRWSCGLRRELGDWQLVHVDPRYLETVKPRWMGTPLEPYDCGEWPAPGFTCPVCGVSGGA